jgi:hypothetical protein
MEDRETWGWGVFLFRRRTEKGRDWSRDEQRAGYQETSNHVP